MKRQQIILTMTTLCDTLDEAVQDNDRVKVQGAMQAIINYTLRQAGFPPLQPNRYEPAAEEQDVHDVTKMT